MGKETQAERSVKEAFLADPAADRLLSAARRMLAFSYAPYSRFHVGAALLDADGGIHTGCNVENAAFGPTNCAERTAFFKAVSEGKRSFTAIAIVGGTDGIEGDFCPPCGVCRQVMAEFCSPETFLILLADAQDHRKVYLLKELLPLSFGAENI